MQYIVTRNTFINGNLCLEDSTVELEDNETTQSFLNDGNIRPYDAKIDAPVPVEAPVVEQSQPASVAGAPTEPTPLVGSDEAGSVQASEVLPPSPSDVAKAAELENNPPSTGSQEINPDIIIA
ncbi:MAG TPA: hypothetical protein PKD15_00830 [Candidatus Saccharibacteria bacterium]|nr:hypothetical protein [Candidatus Saccharibacteria bacterium]